MNSGQIMVDFMNKVMLFAEAQKLTPSIQKGSIILKGDKKKLIIDTGIYGEPYSDAVASVTFPFMHIPDFDGLDEEYIIFENSEKLSEDFYNFIGRSNCRIWFLNPDPNESLHERWYQEVY